MPPDLVRAKVRRICGRVFQAPQLEEHKYPRGLAGIRYLKKLLDELFTPEELGHGTLWRWWWATVETLLYGETETLFRFFWLMIDLGWTDQPTIGVHLQEWTQDMCEINNAVNRGDLRPDQCDDSDVTAVFGPSLQQFYEVNLVVHEAPLAG